jgi:branched-chain amino acid transport system ATP-binding protein
MPMSFNANDSLILVVNNLVATLGGRRVLNTVDVNVARGETVGLFGHNGAGKSTLLRCIMGRVPIESGSIRLAFGRWEPAPSKLVRLGISYLGQSEKIFHHMSVRDNLRVFADAAGLSSIEFDERYLELAKEFPPLNLFHAREAGALSGGERQLVALARTFLTRPRLMLLDEPTNGLSPEMRKTVFDTIRSASKKFGTSILLAEHRVTEALQVCSRAIIFYEGSVKANVTAVELRQNPAYSRLL